MVTLPKDFVATAYPGYFWNLSEQKLYSLKTSGMLKALVFNRPNRWNNNRSGYKISVGGQRKWYDAAKLAKLTPKKSTIPMWTQLELT